jgi:endonuclease/exonuclease/phosphatase family metal-dependent hydrolase
VDVVSVHLDFMSRTVRKKQADELIALMRARNNRLIIMGDLNSGWHEQDSAAKYLAEKLELTAYQPENTTMTTFPALGQRLDWILVSRGFEFAGYKIVGDRVSDHRGVVAEIRLTGRYTSAD